MRIDAGLPPVLFTFGRGRGNHAARRFVSSSAAGGFSMSRPLTRRSLVAAASASAALAVSGGRPALAQAARRIVVASKLDTEGTMLGHMIAGTLEAKGATVERRLQLGPTQIMRAAILAKEIDIYPEYTGNGAFFFQAETDPAWHQGASAYARVKALDAQRNDLAWLQPAPANNSWAIAVRQDLAQEAKLATLDDLARHLRDGGELKLAASAEFVESPAALPSFQRAYGFQLKPEQLLVLAGGDTAVTMRAAAERLNGVNAAMVYGTDGAMSALDLVALADPNGAQIVYEPAPLVRGEVLRETPAIEEWLRPVFTSLTLGKLQALNARIVVGGRQPRDVARDHLRRLGIVG